jgi:hypothetical protein
MHRQPGALSSIVTLPSARGQTTLWQVVADRPRRRNRADPHINPKQIIHQNSTAHTGTNTCWICQAFGHTPRYVVRHTDQAEPWHDNACSATLSELVSRQHG